METISVVDSVISSTILHNTYGARVSLTSKNMLTDDLFITNLICFQYNIYNFLFY